MQIMNHFQSYLGIGASEKSNDKKVLELTDGCGYYVIDNVISLEDLRLISQNLIEIEKQQLDTMSIDETSPEYGQIRSPFLFSKTIRRLLCSELIIKLVKKHLVGNGICHLVNGQIVRKSNAHNQSLYHRDFNKTHISNPIIAFNTLFMLGEYSDIKNLSTQRKKHKFAVLPKSHNIYGLPNKSLLKKEKIISLKPGSLLVFNSQLWHRVLNTKNDQLFLNIMFTEPFIKQQINLLGTSIEWINEHSNIESDLARLLGWWSRPPVNIEEFRNPPNNIRTYRPRQG